MQKLFQSRNKELQIDINSYLDKVESAGLLFFEGVKTYLKDNQERFEGYHKELDKLESSADDYRREIKYKLYAYMLIPEARGDVLGMLETIDNVIGIANKVLKQLSIEQPKIPEFLSKDFLDLAEFSYLAVEALVKCARAFFTEIKLVNNYVNKVHFYEHEADKLEEKIKRAIFDQLDSHDLSRKVHLRYFVEKISLLSDESESVSERIAVYAIKRRI